MEHAIVATIDVIDVIPLSDDEREEYTYRCQEIVESIEDKNRATSRLVRNVDFILRKRLWREDFSSAKEFIRTMLHVDNVQCSRLTKANRLYLYLLQQTEDEEEKATLSMMRETAFRELRRLAVSDDDTELNNRGESLDEYQARLDTKEAEDFEKVHNLWNWVYPKIKSFKLEKGIDIVPTGGFSIMAKDITESATVLQDLLHGIDESKIEIEGRNISMQDIAEASGDNVEEVLDALTTLGVSERLTEKLARQKQHLSDALSKKYLYDIYTGKLEYKDGRLFITNEFGSIEFLQQVADKIGKDVSISIRTLNENI